MSTLVARDVRASFAGVPVLHGVDVVVGPGTRLGLVGPNGAGKSTLLKALVGDIALDGGTVTVTGTVGYLPQEPDRRPGETLLAYLGRRTGVSDADAAMQAAAEALESESAEAADAYAHALDRWLALGGADLDSRAAEVIADLGLPQRALEQETTGLSGGEMARASLAAVLLSRYDVLLLDEPTNDLDLEGLDRLERFVQGLRGGLVVVSHDREFLERTVTVVLELDPYNKLTRTIEGGWDAYLAEREIARRQARERYEDYEDRRDRLVGQVQSTREMSVRGALRAKRRAPDNDRSIRSYKIESATSAASKVRTLETRLERLEGEGVVEPRKEWQLRLELPMAPRSGTVVATLRQAVVRRGAFTLGPVDLDLQWADRVAIVGANGSGKTTLLHALLGRMPLDSGTATLGSGVVVGELDQARRTFDVEATVVDVLEGITEAPVEEVRTLLAKFGPATSAARPRRCRRASGPGPAWHCFRPGAPTAWCWTSPLTTSTCPRSSSSRRRCRSTPAPCCWSPTTGGCSRPSPPSAAGRSNGDTSRRTSRPVADRPGPGARLCAVDKKQWVEYSYVAAYGVLLIIAFGLSWITANADPKAYRRLVPPLGFITALIIFGGILIAQHTYPGG